jgi:hypothetical protein
MRLSLDEHELDISGPDESEKLKQGEAQIEMGRTLQRWSSEISSLIGEMYILFFAVREDQNLRHVYG